mmetsp:Transcript_32450/g.95651  ORF Transcript_32450/g.95651 Transcript_32450/m.95651 type:complete len:336 (+) Transcript_32450:1082-2089(+)
MGDELARQGPAEFGNEGRILRLLPGDRQGQILRVHDAPDESEPIRQDVLRLALDEDLAAVQRHPRLHPSHAVLLGMEGGDEEQRLDLQRGVGAVVQPIEGFVEGVGDEFVKGRVGVVVDLTGFEGPHGLHGVDPVAVEVDGEIDEVGILLQHGFDALLVGVDQVVLLEMDDDGGAAILPDVGGEVADVVRTDALGTPDEGAVRLILLLRLLADAGRPGPDLDPVPYHEGRVEADAELANDAPGGVESASGLGGLGQLVDKGLGTRPGDRSQILHHLGLGQTDARVGYGQRSVELVGFDAYFQGNVVVGVAIGGIDGGVGSSGADLPDVAELLEGV